MPNRSNNYGGMTDAEIVNQIRAWGALAPHEPNGYDARIDEAKWEMENVYHIPNFWAPDLDEMEAFETDYQKHCESYIIWK